MSFSYDDQNIFAKILRGEIPCKKVLETEHSLAFHDINPQAEVHVLLIPKGPYVTYDHFAEAASEAEIIDFVRALGQLARQLGVNPPEGGKGSRILSNNGPDAHQEVPHLHIHLFGGEFLGRMVSVPSRRK